MAVIHFDVSDTKLPDAVRLAAKATALIFAAAGYMVFLLLAFIVLVVAASVQSVVSRDKDELAEDDRYIDW